MGQLVVEGPFEPGTITLVDVEDGIDLHYGGSRMHPSGSRRLGTNINIAVPGMCVGKRWYPESQVRGWGIIVAVVDNDHPFGPAVHVLWSEDPTHRSASVDELAQASWSAFTRRQDLAAKDPSKRCRSL